MGYNEAGAEIESETDEDFCVELAESLIAAAHDGQTGRTAVDLPADADPVEAALVLPRMFAETRGSVRLDEIVAVVTAPDVRALLFRDGETGSGSSVGLSEQLALQLEFATAIVLVDAHLVGEAGLGEIYGAVNKLNPCARQLVLTSDGRPRRLGEVAPRARAETLGRACGWMLELSGAALPTTVNGIGSVVYRDPRPFHPLRLAAAVESWLEPADAGLIVRSRGLVKLATRADRIGSWSTAGEVLAVDPTAMMSWHADTPAGQELVFFGRDLNRDYIVRVLDSCVLSDDELVAGPMEWETYYDPFPAWDLDHGH
jgi:G3E family GTPase